MLSQGISKSHKTLHPATTPELTASARFPSLSKGVLDSHPNPYVSSYLAFYLSLQLISETQVTHKIQPKTKGKTPAKSIDISEKNVRRGGLTSTE